MSVSDTMIGRIFDKRYVIKRKLGSGGMADVYLAEDQELGRLVALKLLDDRHAADDRVRNSRFLQAFDQPAHGLMHRVFALKEHVDFSEEAELLGFPSRPGGVGMRSRHDSHQKKRGE